MQIIPIYDKLDEKYRIIITEITERKKAEDNVQELLASVGRRRRTSFQVY